jgi:hypothetical protein
VKLASMVVVVLALAALAGPASAQTGSSVLLFGGAAGAKVVSETNISARVQGELVVTFHGDAAAGCAARGVCSYSGTIVARPRSGQVGVVTYRRQGQTGHLVFVSLGSPEDAYPTSARVTRSVGGATAGTCADAQSPFFSGQDSASIHGASVTIRLLAPRGVLLQTRCAGPTDGDLAAASPVTTIRLARLLRGGIALDLTGSRTFANHGFAGTINSTLTVKLGKPNSQPVNPTFPPDIKTHRVRTVIEQLRVVRVRGGFTATVRGTGNPIVCGLLDSCGLRGTLSLTGPLHDVSAQLIATGPARRPYADFLAALGLSRTGRARGIGVFGSVNWLQDVRSDVSQAGNVCTDTAPSGGIAVPLGIGGPIGGFTGPWRTRCPGPSLDNARLLLSAPLTRSQLGHRRFTIHVGGKGTSSDDGYTIRSHGRLSLVLRRGRVTQQVTAEPTD